RLARRCANPPGLRPRAVDRPRPQHDGRTGRRRARGLSRGAAGRNRRRDAMKWRWPWQRDAAADAAPAATPTRGARLRWLAWDGRTLRWQLGATAAVATELRIDGVVFQRFEAGTGERTFEVAFEFSPTGNDELEFGIADAVQHAPLAAPW